MYLTNGMANAQQREQESVNKLLFCYNATGARHFTGFSNLKAQWETGTVNWRVRKRGWHSLIGQNTSVRGPPTVHYCGKAFMAAESCINTPVFEKLHWVMALIMSAFVSLIINRLPALFFFFLQNGIWHWQRSKKTLNELFYSNEVRRRLVCLTPSVCA